MTLAAAAAARVGELTMALMTLAQRLSLAPRLAARGLAPRLAARGFRATAKASADSSNIVSELIYSADSSTAITHHYHTLTMGLVGLVPVSLALSPSAVNMPVDLALGLGIPLYAHISAHILVTDYAPLILGEWSGNLGKKKWLTNGLRGAILMTTVVSTLGLLKLNLAGPGLTETVKGLWREKPTPAIPRASHTK